jgi:hypothetical protein
MATRSVADPRDRVLGKILPSILVGLALATPGTTWAAPRGGHAMAPRPFNLGARPQAFARHERPGFGGLGASGAYTTLLSGTFESPPPDTGPGFVVPPPFCYGMPPIAPQERCVRPLLIHLVPQQPAKNLPRVVYGSPFDCSG